MKLLQKQLLGKNAKTENIQFTLENRFTGTGCMNYDMLTWILRGEEKKGIFKMYVLCINHNHHIKGIVRGQKRKTFQI